MIKNVGKAIFELLRDDPAVGAVVTNGGISRIYPFQLPQGVTSPSVVYNLITEDTDYNMNASSGLVMSRYQIDSIAPTQAGAFDLSDLVKDVLSGFRGNVAIGSNSPQDEITIRGIFGDSGRTLFDATSKLYTSQRDYLIWYAEF